MRFQLRRRYDYKNSKKTDQICEIIAQKVTLDLVMQCLN